jgi:hypothetical protein
LLLPQTVLDVRDDVTRRLLWRVPAREGSTVDLDYTNSLFNAPATDRFVIQGSALRLVEISSTKEAVLEHAGLAGPHKVRGGRFVAERPGPVLAELTIRIGQTGQQRLVVDGRNVPLYRTGVGEALHIRVARTRRLFRLVETPRPP